MKRMMISLAVVVLAAALALPAFGAEASHAPDGAPETEVGSVANAGALLQAWSGYEGYPDYVCGVWSTDGSENNLTIAVTADEAGVAGREEILAMVEDDSTLTFTEMVYPFHALYKVQLALQDSMGGESGVYTLGVMEMDNCVTVGIDKTAPGAETFMAQAARYGDMVRFEDMTGVVVMDAVATTAPILTTGMAEETGRTASGQYVLSVCLAAVVVCGGVFLALRRVRRKEG